MTARVGEDFDDFVVARWPDLEAVALAATLDPQTARDLTAETLAALRSRWREVLEDGAPTATVRRDLLARVGRTRPGRAGSGPATAPDESVRVAVEDESASVPGALVDALAAEPPLARAALAATVLWELPEDGLAPLLGRSSARPDVHAARLRVLEAHRRARVADGLDEADHRLDDDLADALHRLAALQPGPPDPDDLVRRRSARVRRRHVVLGAAGFAVVAGAAGALALRAGPDSAGRVASPSTPPLPAGTDAAWSRTRTWAPRGDLRTDPRIPAVLVDPEGSAAQLVYAGDLHGRRVVVASEGTVALAGELRVWTGPAGTPPEQLAQVQLGLPGIYDDVALVAVGVPHPAGALVLVLARPTVREAQLSFTVRPRPDGGIDRTWQGLGLDAGVGSLLLPGPPGLASRLRCDGYDGPLPRPGQWDSARLGGTNPDPGDADGADEALRSDVAVATGIPRERLEARTDFYVLPGEVSIFGGSITGRVTVRLQQVRTPEGAVLRSSYIEATSADGSVTGYGDVAAVIPADAADAPYVTQVDDDPSGRGTFAVLTDRSASTVRLYGGTGPDDLLGPPARVRDGAAVVRGRVAGPPARLVVRGADGTVLYDDPPVDGRWLFDLYDLRAPGV